MSQPHLAKVLDPGDLLIAALQTKLQRLFPGIKVKRLEGGRGPEICGHRLPSSVGLTVFGPEALLLEHGLLTPELLSVVPRSGDKFFPSRLRNAGHSSMKRGKTGTSLCFHWGLGGSPDELANSPLWIRSELMRLKQIISDAETAAKPKPAPPVKKTPEKEWQSRALVALFAISGLIPDAEGLVDENSILASDSPMKKHERAMVVVAAHLKQIMSESISATEVASVVSHRHLRLVVDNTVR